MKPEEEFETFLRQFVPRRPRPLERVWPTARWPRLTAVAAVAVLLAWVASLRFTPEPSASAVTDLTVGGVVRQTKLDADALEQLLFDLSPRLLPDVERAASTFRPLSRP